MVTGPPPGRGIDPFCGDERSARRFRGAASGENAALHAIPNRTTSRMTPARDIAPTIQHLTRKARSRFMSQEDTQRDDSRGNVSTSPHPRHEPVSCHAY